jgi:hypothetical protein
MLESVIIAMTRFFSGYEITLAMLANNIKCGNPSIVEVSQMQE